MTKNIDTTIDEGAFSINVETSIIVNEGTFNLLIDSIGIDGSYTEINKPFDDEKSPIYKTLNNNGYKFENLKTLIICPYYNVIIKKIDENQIYYPLWLSDENTGISPPPEKTETDSSEKTETDSSGLIYIDMNNFLGLDKQVDSSYFGDANKKITDIILIYNETIDWNNTGYINIYSNAFNKYPKLKNVYIYGIPNFYNVNGDDNYYLFHEDIKPKKNTGTTNETTNETTNKVQFCFIKPSNIDATTYENKINTFLKVDVSNSNITKGCLFKPNVERIEQKYRDQNECINTKILNYQNEIKESEYFNKNETFQKFLINKCKIRTSSKFLTVFLNNFVKIATKTETGDTTGGTTGGTTGQLKQVQIVQCSVE